MNKFVLGTAQFGLDYGINNKRGKIPKEEVFSILDKSLENNINSLDTASSYGESEKVIGEFIKSRKADFKVISKLPSTRPEDISNTFEISLSNLGLNRLYGYLIHDFDYFVNNPTAWDQLKRIKDEQKIEKIGFSLYSPGELEYLLDKKIKMDIVQVSYNVFDQRFSQYFSLLRDLNVEIHVRSVFLQGLLFKKAEDLPGRFLHVKGKMKRLQDISHSSGLRLSALYLGFVLTNPFVDRVIIGIDSKENLEENINSLEYLAAVKNIYHELKALSEEDESVILPVNW